MQNHQECNHSVQLVRSRIFGSTKTEKFFGLQKKKNSALVYHQKTRIIRHFEAFGSNVILALNLLEINSKVVKTTDPLAVHLNVGISQAGFVNISGIAIARTVYTIAQLYLETWLSIDIQAHLYSIYEGETTRTRSWRNT